MKRMPYNPEQHHRRSIRAANYDYAGGGTYFVTICTAEREMLFGENQNGLMTLNEFGCIAKEEWERSADIRREIQLEAFVIMPNHVHGLVTIVPEGLDGAVGGTSITLTEQVVEDGGLRPRACSRTPLR